MGLHKISIKGAHHILFCWERKKKPREYKTNLLQDFLDTEQKLNSASGDFNVNVEIYHVIKDELDKIEEVEARGVII